MALRSWKQVVGGHRYFHSCQTNLYRQKKKPLAENPVNLFKRGTPKDTGGSIQNFKRTAAHSKFAASAPAIPDDAPGGQTLTLDPPPGGVIGQYPIKVAKALARLGSYKRNQRNELFKEHTTFIREATSIPMFEIIEQGMEMPSRENRHCIMGDPGVGKSTLLAQAHAFALAKGYVVIPIPLPSLLLSGELDAVFDHRTGLFSQPMYAKRWVRRIVRSNSSMLKTMKVQLDHSKGSGTYQPHRAPSLENLLTFCRAAIPRKDAFVIAGEIIQELVHQDKVPILFTMDDVNVLSNKLYAENRDTDNNKIYHGDLQMIKYFLDFLSGQRSFKKGAILTAVSGNHGLNDTIPVGLKLGEPIAYTKKEEYDPVLASKFSGVKPFNVSRLSIQEAATTLDYFHKAKIIQQCDETTVQEKYFMSGNGNPRELLRSCIELSY